ncbi:MAG: 3-hydroxybutyrate dehydrogenase [Deltaproteobacteria bacterium]|nr:3-hydroxybutyrate dehydrogenase [Deltaproteobacteria bacterium]
MTTQLEGKTALVTGAGRGIGRAICIALAREGAAVAAVARTRDEIESVAAEIRAAGGRAIALVADVTKDDQILASVDAARKELGSVDILVNNAGDNILGRIEEQDPEVWWQQIVVGLRAPYLYSRAVIPAMREKKWGRIINISSVNGKKGAELCSAYCTAKHGVIGFTRALALEVAKSNITVNAVCPGYVRTSLTDRTMSQRTDMFGTTREAMEQMALKTIPQGVVMTPEEIAPSVIFLASEAAARITGEAMNVSAGLVMH